MNVHWHNNQHWWFVEAEPEWLSSNWPPDTDRNDSIVFFTVCESLMLPQSTGGRAGFAPNNTVPCGDLMDNIVALLQRMKKPSSRTAGQAYNLGGYTWGWTMVAIKPQGFWTTLCPAPRAWFPGVASVFRGWGCAIFDTYMDGGIPAASALTASDSPTGEAWGFRWIDHPGDGPYGLGFDYLGSHMEMTAHADKCLNRTRDGGTGRELDGEPGDSDNGEDLTWFIYDSFP